MAIDTMVTGTIRIVHRDANDNIRAELYETHTSIFGGTLGVPMIDPQRLPKIDKRRSTIMADFDRLVIQFRPDVTRAIGTAAGFVPAANRRFIRIPITYKNTTTGVAFKTIFTDQDFVDRKVAVAGDRYVAGIWYDIEQYSIPPQTNVKLGHDPVDVRVDSAISYQREIDIA